VLGRVHHKQLTKPKISCIQWKVKTVKFSALTLFLRPDNNSLFGQMGRKIQRKKKKTEEKRPG